ncbi:PucR family transcriptional regulator [Arsenicicoccus sp. oral taxon 190]|uniref:PucR family transcriptional regulator n=1 Tax=Arsenicicoccus sp. oral taxon 190 TaxID=1658671 RepID=UPI00067A30EA|nr:helix-turn-helix domain-containing protein [Arsenicicoccus sp. oral taxon 190]AKT52129.1 PucR family transcriptional regulator [Arsenicicoccus sp. oral taxon 190]
MPSAPPMPSPASLRRVQSSAGALATAATARIEARHEWYRALSAEDRSWVGLVAQAGIGSFLTWLRDPGSAPMVTTDVFGTAPRELTRSVTLAQTLDLVRSVVGVVEERVDELAAEDDEPALREAVLRYSREVAFAAAQIYAEAAESRGAWDARLESLVVDAVIRGEADNSLRSRATALGWGSIEHVTVVAGPSPREETAHVMTSLRRAANRLGVEALSAVQGRRLLVILGGTEDPRGATEQLLAYFGDGPVVLGPTVPHLFAAGRSARTALSGLAAARAWPEVPRPADAAELLPERVLAGDNQARKALLDRIHAPLLRAGGGLLETADRYLDEVSLEATARALFVHANTVRYRLGRIAEITGYDLALPREAYAVRVALALGRLSTPPTAPWR